MSEYLPNNWIKVSLEDLCNSSDGLRRGPFGSAIKKEFFVPDGYKVYEQSNAIYDDVHRGKYFITESKFNELHNFSVQEGDFLVSCSGTLGKITLVPKGAKVGIINQALLRIRTISELINTKYFLYFFRSESFQRKIFDQSQGTAMSNLIGIKDFKLLELPLPPIAEQHRIVAKIEELFSELDKGIETLKTAKQQLKVYRQAVLKYAFEGKLTNPDVKEGELPEGWVRERFEDVSIKIGDIDHKMPSKVDDGVFPYLSTGDITDENKLDFDKCKLISKEDFLRLSKKIKPQKGDIIFPRYGTIGRNVLVQTDIDFLISYSCAIIKPNPAKIDSNYFYHYTLSSLTNKEIKKYVVQTTQANVGISSIKAFFITFPESIVEQKKVVGEIESRLSVCDKIEESIEQGLQQAEALRQSILKKAFEGKLVPQEPNDEPASVLLDRISVGRANAKPEKKTRTMKSKV